MNLSFVEMYQMNLDTESYSKISDGEVSSDFVEYVSNLLDSMSKDTAKRKFVFASKTTEIHASLLKFLNGDEVNIGEICASRLLREEISTQKAIEHLGTEIHKGILFIAIVDDEGIKKVILSKNDHNLYLDEEKFTKRSGLPIEKKVFKSFIGVLNSGNEFDTIDIYDTNTRLSTYWWKDFLELREEHTDEYNSIRAFKAIDTGVLSIIKNKYPADYVELRNSTVHSFRTVSEFNYPEYIENTWKKYDPINPAFPKESYIEKLKDLPEKKKFDERFSIPKGAITARTLSTSYKLTEKIELILKEDIEYLKNIIKAAKDPDGTKYVKIISERGYEAFKDKEQSITDESA